MEQPAKPNVRKILDTTRPDWPERAEQLAAQVWFHVQKNRARIRAGAVGGLEKAPSLV